MNDNIYNNDLIKTFLNIIPLKEPNNSLYSIDLSKNIFSLYSPEKIRKDFELDKIFTNKDENSYIFETICTNNVKECIEGTSFSYIIYGETINNKIEFLTGNLVNNSTNINNYGIFIRFLDNLLIKKDLKEFNYSIKFSNFIIFDNNLIDLTYFGNTIKEKYEIDINLLLSKAYKIKNDSNIINNMNKVNVTNINDIIKYLYNIMELLYKLDRYIYSKFNICFIIYLIDETTNKTISTISFISLSGSEHLYVGQNKKKIIKDKSKNNNDEIEATKSSIEIRFNFDSILKCIENNNYIKSNIKNIKNYYKENDGDKMQIEDKKSLSQLTTVLYDICFGKNISNIKFRFIGNIRPVEGYYENTKDVLIFLFDCSKIMKNVIKSQKKLIIEEDFKNEEIFNLEYKIKMQSITINNLNNILNEQNKKILFLEKTYREQISAVKKYFNFKGDINILLSGDENSKEMQFVEKLKNLNLLLIKYENTIKYLEKELKFANDEINKLKIKLNNKELDQTMINYYLSAQTSKDKKLNVDNNKNLNELYTTIDKLQKEKINKDKIIEALKKDLNKKNNFFCNLPKSLINPKKNDEQNENNEQQNNENSKQKTKKNDLNESEITDITLKQELVKMKIKEQKNIEELKEKYDYILLEKKNTIYELEHKFEKIDEQYKYEFKKTNLELTKIYGMIISLITYIEKNKKMLLKEKNSNELEKIIFSIKDDIKEDNYPFLFKELEIQKRLKEKNEKERNKDIYIDKENNNINNNNEEFIDYSKDEIIEKLKNKIKNLSLSYDVQLKKYNNNLFLLGLHQRTIDKLKREINIYKLTLKNKNISPPIISLNIKNNNFSEDKESKKDNKNININKVIKNNITQKSLSFVNEKNKFEIPFKLLQKKYLSENEGYNIDSFRHPLTNSTNFNGLLKPSSPSTSSYTNTNTNTNNYNNSFLNTNFNKIFYKREKKKNEYKNNRPFSAIKQRENLTFFKKQFKTKI